MKNEKTKTQSKKKSLFESVIQTLVGLIFTFLIQYFLYPIMEIEVSINQNLQITFVFFIASIIRQYFIRRFFEKLK